MNEAPRARCEAPPSDGPLVASGSASSIQEPLYDRPLHFVLVGPEYRPVAQARQLVHAQVIAAAAPGAFVGEGTEGGRQGVLGVDRLGRGAQVEVQLLAPQV